MKILFITQIYPANPKRKRGDKRLALHYYVREWLETHDVEVIRLHNIPFWRSWLFPFIRYPKKYVLDGVIVYNILAVQFSKKIISYLNIRKRAKVFLPDITIAHIPESLMSAQHLMKKYGIPYVAGIQKTDYRVSGLKLKGKVYPYYEEMLQKAFMVAFWSDFLANQFLNHIHSLKVKSIAMPGGITEEWLTPEPSIRNWNKSKFQIATVAQLVDQKRIPVVIDALTKKRINLYRYHIIGSGRKKRYLVNYAQKMGLNDQVIFHGHLATVEIIEILDECEIMVLLSTNETFGLVYLEAMARGCIVIGTKGEGIDGVIKNGINGFLCDSESSELSDLLVYIQSLSEKQLDKISNEAINTARKFMFKYLAKEYLNCLHHYYQIHLTAKL